MPALRRRALKVKVARRAAAVLSAAKVRIPLKKHHTLSVHGYVGVGGLSVAQRRVALVKAAAALGPTYVIRKLNVLAIYNRNKNPGLAAIFRKDMAFVQSLRAAAK